jgi:serine/threonine-protein kinase
MPYLEGQVLKERYRIEKLIGRGGMAEVYKAWDMRRQYNVAIKVMREDLAEDIEFVRRFRREAQALAALSHANIVRFYSLEREERLVFIVMDYVEGTTLRGRIMDAGGEPLPLDKVAWIMEQSCAALHYAHSENVLHRDVKPGNIMIRINPLTGHDERALVADYGIAKAADAATATTVMPGTPAYMSPEQCRSEVVDERTDVYSLGIVAYEMLAGRRPFVGDTATPPTTSTRERIRWEQMHQQPPSLRQFNPAVSPEVEAVILKALAKKREDRWPTALALWKALAEALGTSVTQVYGPPIVEPPRVPPPPPGKEEPGEEPPSWTRVPLWAWLVGAAALVLLIFLLARAVVPGNPTPTAIPIVQITDTAPMAPATGAPTSPPTESDTPSPPEPTQTRHPTATRTANPTKSATPTRRPTATATRTLSPTSTATEIPTPTPTPPCNLPVDGQLAGAWERGRLGCPTARSIVTWAAWEPFERGYMLWRDDNDTVHVLYLRNGTDPSGGTWEMRLDRWDGSNPNGVGMSPPPGLREPIRGFGWLWREVLGGSQSQLGWATEEEKGFCANLQPFENGLIFHSSTITYCKDELYNWATHPSFTPLYFSLDGSGSWRRH